MSMLQWIVFLGRCRNAYYAALHTIWLKCLLGLIKHGALFVLTVYFVAEGADPYAPMHIVLADMIWVYSVMFYYLDKFVRFVWPATKAWFEKYKYAICHDASFLCLG